MAQTFRRDGLTWLAYALLSLYGYFLNVLGPITPFLQDELKLSYTVASLHFTAFGVGIVLVGLAGHLVIKRVGRWNSLWLGAAGLSAGALLLVFARHPIVTIGASFVMGSIGSLILVLVVSILSDYHGERRAVALAEGNTLSSLVAALSALLVGWAAQTPAGWRLALAVVAFTPVLLRLGLRRARAAVASTSASVAVGHSTRRGRTLPARFWVYWAALVLSVSVEFCMIFWSAAYLETNLGLARAGAAQAVSLFLGGMILGRLAGSRLVQRMPPARVVTMSVAIAGAGFLMFWLPRSPLLAEAGLFVTGLGVASLYPMILSLALATAPESAVEAGARLTLASGTAILALPLVLGRLADAAGIGPAYAIIPVLLSGAFLIIEFTSRRPLAPAATVEG